MTAASPDLGRELAVAIELAKQAGTIVLGVRRGGELGVERKAHDEPVTIADRQSSDLIVRGLETAFPGDRIISEEVPITGPLDVARMWLVDPIDGTEDFIRGRDGFSVMIGLVQDGRPVLGVVHQPVVGRTYYASPAGAFIETDGLTSPLHVSSVLDAGSARLVASASHRSTVIDDAKKHLGITDEQNIGSVGVKLCLIAQASRDLYINPTPKTKAWDTCAPEAILVGAGGKLTELDGSLIDYTLVAPRHGLIATNGLIHDEVVAKLTPLFAKRS